MRLYLVTFGKLKTAGLRETADYYLRLIQGWVPCEEIELKPISVPDKSAQTRARIQEQEERLLLEKLSSKLGSRGRFYLLDERGRDRTTMQWADLVREWEDQSVSEVAICIGSSLGFTDAVRKKSAGMLSFGRQTLPHELARVVCLEQIFRAWSVVRGHPYHNEG